MNTIENKINEKKEIKPKEAPEPNEDIEPKEELEQHEQNNKIINYDDYDDLYDFNLNNFKSKSGNTHRDNKQTSKKKIKI